MTRFEYKVMPAPRKGTRAKGARSTEARFAVALQEAMNAAGREGWEYVRTDTLPCEERVGLTGRTTVYQNMLVFRRALPAASPATGATEPAAARAPSPELPPLTARREATGAAGTPPPAPAAPPARPERVPTIESVVEEAQGKARPGPGGDLAAE